jgi:ABC-type dipeptide/oligopeptide/nickel transport system permease component
LLLYLLRKIGVSLITVLAGATVIFLMVHMIPGDPVAALLVDVFSSETYDAVRTRLGLDQPLVVQYLSFMRNVATGNLGTSFRSGQPVIGIVAEQFLYTVELAAAAIAIAIVLGIPIGVVAAVHRGGPADYLTMAGALLAICVPNFVLGLGMLLLFSLRLGWFPTISVGQGGLFEAIRAAALPATALGLRTAALLSRISRSSLLNVLNLDYIRTARAKGVSGRAVLYRHALRNSLLPVITILGLSLGQLLGGTAIIEIVFSRPGIGRLLVDAVVTRDFPIIQGTMLVFLVNVTLINMLVDVAYSFADPRIKYE